MIRVSRVSLSMARLALLAALLLAALFGALAAGPGVVRAQETLGSYTVQPGDTLFAIAQRFDVSLDSLIAANGITDPNLLVVGQVLLIPGADSQSAAISAPFDETPARAGETIGALAARLGLDGATVAAFNNLTTTARLFPGQPVRVPEGSAPPQPLRFGAVAAIDAPASLIQGRTGRLVITSDYPLGLAANWNGLPLTLAPLDAITRQVALLPVPALITPGSYPVTITYSTRAGIPVAHTLSVRVDDGGYESQVISVPADRTDLLDPARVQTELMTVTTAWSGFTTDLVLRRPFSRPIGVEYATTSPFGTRRNYDSGVNSTAGYHTGQDFGAPEGMPVLAPATGIVALAQQLEVRGNAVLLDHGRGLYSGFWHLSELRVLPGQVVQAGEVIGLVGNTGLSTGAHLHWEMRIYGIAVDPMQYLDEAPFPE